MPRLKKKAQKGKPPHLPTSNLKLEAEDKNNYLEIISDFNRRFQALIETKDIDPNSCLEQLIDLLNELETQNPTNICPRFPHFNAIKYIKDHKYLTNKLTTTIHQMNSAIEKSKNQHLATLTSDSSNTPHTNLNVACAASPPSPEQNADTLVRADVSNQPESISPPLFSENNSGMLTPGGNNSTSATDSGDTRPNDAPSAESKIFFTDDDFAPVLFSSKPKSLKSPLIWGTLFGVGTFAIESLIYEFCLKTLNNFSSELSQIGGIWSAIAMVAVVVALLAFATRYYLDKPQYEQPNIMPVL